MDIIKAKNAAVQKLLSFVRRTAVRNSGMASLKGSFEPKIPEKLAGGGWRAESKIEIDALDIVITLGSLFAIGASIVIRL